MLYDVVIAGAGPAGLMAALTAAGKGLRVVIVEKFTDVSKIHRACCQQFVMDENYENENIQVSDGRITFPHNGFEVAYPGPVASITDTCFISPRGHAVRFSYPDKRPVAIKFDKGLLLQTLLQQCAAAGVVFRNSTLAYSAEAARGHVDVHTIHQGKRSVLTAKKLIAADGVNSPLAAALGMNQGRVHFATALCIIYSLEGVEEFEHTAMKWHMGRAYFSNGPVILDPSLESPNIADLVIMGSSLQKPEQIFHDFTRKSPRAFMFERARIIRKTGCTVKAYSSMPVPHRGNALVIGDAAAYVEVEVQGALMCGFHAGHAVYRELNNENGFEQYARWWRQSFEFNSEQALRVAQGYALVPTYTDDEIDYLFGLVAGKTLDGAYGQYKAPKLLWDAILEHREKIARDRPDLYQKISRNAEMTLADAFKV